MDIDNNPIDDPVANRLMDVGQALVRPVVTVLFALSAIIFTWMGIVSGDFFMGVATAVISYWFGQRTGQHAATTAQQS